MPLKRGKVMFTANFGLKVDSNSWKQSIKRYVKGENPLFIFDQISPAHIKIIFYKSSQAKTARFLSALVYLIADIQILL
jgi:hypothetical protein